MPFPVSASCLHISRLSFVTTMFPDSSVSCPCGVGIGPPSLVPIPTTLMCTPAFEASVAASRALSSKSSPSVRITIALPKSFLSENDWRARVMALPMAVPWSESMLGDTSERNSCAVERSVVMGSCTNELPAKTISPTLSERISSRSFVIVRLAKSRRLGATSWQSMEFDISRQIIASIPLLSSSLPEEVRPGTCGRARATMSSAKAESTRASRTS